MLKVVVSRYLMLSLLAGVLVLPGCIRDVEGPDFRRDTGGSPDAGADAQEFDVEPSGEAVAMELFLPGGELHVGAEATVAVSFLNADGGPAPAPGVALTWSSSDEAIATVAGGRVRGESIGDVTIRAEADGLAGELKLEVVFRWASIKGGDGHTCALTEVGLAYCWGQNDRGQLGDGTQVSRHEPAPVATEVRFAELSLGDRTSCGRSLSGPVYCWGDNRRGGVGVQFWAFEEAILEPRRVFLRLPGDVLEPVEFTSLSTGREYSCGTTPDGRTYCWGFNNNGQVGLNPQSTEPEQDRPRLVVMEGEAVEVGAAYLFACAAMDDGELACWGRAGAGTEGLETAESPATFVPPQARDFGMRLSGLAGGTNYLCGEGDGGDLYCFGENGSGQLGVGDTESRTAPTRVGSFSKVAAYDQHSCALNAEGRVYCWGSNGAGQADPGSSEASLPSPVEVALPAGIYRAVGVGRAHGCAVSEEGRAFCWGQEGSRLGGEAGSDGVVEVPRG